jgi:hypothetical protein
VTFTAAVSATVAAGRPTGSVQFFVDGDPIGDAVGVRGGRAVSGPVRPTPGDHLVEARYLGATTFSESATTMTQRVTAAPGGGGGAAPGPGAGRGDAGAARISLLGKRARVDDEGTFRLAVACHGGPCAGSVAVRSGRKVLARRLLSLQSGERASVPVDLGRAGERRISRGASVPAVVHLRGEGRTASAAAKMKLLPTRAPLVRVLTRAARLDGRDGIRLRVACRAPRAGRCQGGLTLRGADGRTLATAPISLPGAATSTVRLQLGGPSEVAGGRASAADGPDEPLALTGTVAALSEVPVGRDVRTATRIVVSAR